MAIAGGVGTNGKYYRLEADLVGAESITQPIGNDGDKRFIGHFDGGGHHMRLLNELLSTNERELPRINTNFLQNSVFIRVIR